MFLTLLKYFENISCGNYVDPISEPSIKPELLLVYYLMEGDDHVGYCSGTEAEIEREEIIELIETSMFTPQDFDRDGWLHSVNLNKLDKYNGGCTSGGSGYCDGFYQDYKATKAQKIKIKKMSC